MREEREKREKREKMEKMEKEGNIGYMGKKTGKLSLSLSLSVPGTFWNIPDCWLRKYKKNESRMSLSPRLYKVQ